MSFRNYYGSDEDEYEERHPPRRDSRKLLIKRSLRDWDEDDLPSAKKIYEEDDIEWSVPYKFADDREKKHYDLQAGNMSNVPGAAYFDSDAGGNVRRRTIPLIAIDEGTDTDERTGFIVQGSRVSIRGFTWFGAGLNTLTNARAVDFWAILRVIVFVDKSLQFNPNQPNWAIGGNGTVDNTWVPDQGFLESPTITTFYNPDIIKNYRVLYDSGCITFKPDKANVNIPTGQYNADMNATNVPLRQLNAAFDYTGNFKFQSTIFTEDDGDSVVGDIDLDQTIIGEVTGVGVGVEAFDVALESISEFSDVTFDKLRANTVPATTSAVTPAITFDAPNMTAVNRIEYFKPAPDGQYFDINIDLNELDVQFNGTTDPGGLHIYPIRNDIRMGLLYYSTSLKMRYSFNTRFEYYDD